MGVSCSEGVDCNGECGGSAVVDACGECGGPGYNEGGCCDEEGVDCVSYAEIQSDIFDNFVYSCSGCHNGTHSSELDLSSYSATIVGGKSGVVVIPFNHANSLLWQYVNTGYMPSGSNELLPAEVDLIATWINQGAIETPIPTLAN